MRPGARILLCWVGSLFLLSACNLAGDVTPPPGAALTAPAPERTTTEPDAVLPPSTPPDIGAGAEIYADRCAPCHGDQGLGDGPQAQDLPVQPAALGDPELAESAVPAEWYEIVTNGRMDRLMPPFGGLSDQERWDVVGYALTLSVEDQQRNRGRTLFERHCVDCHLPTAGGTSEGVDLSAPEQFAQLSRARAGQVVREGVGEEMPAFEGVLNEAGIEAVAAYTQALAWQGGEAVVGQTEEGEARQSSQSGEVEEAEQLQVTGTIRNGTREGGVAERLEVTLHGFDGREEVLSTSISVDSGGTYRFSDLEPTPGRIYAVSADYHGVRYVSPVVELEPGTASLELPVTVYEVTNDPETVRTRQLHVLIDQPRGERIQVVELWLLVNTGDRTVLPQGGQGGVEIHLPEGAENVRFEDPRQRGRVMTTEAGFVLSRPLRPGGQELQLGFSFEIPYRGGAELEQRMSVPVESVSILAVEAAPAISGSGVMELGRREAEGEVLDLYEVQGLAAGQTLRLQLGARPLWARWLPEGGSSGLWIGLVILALVVAGILWWYGVFEPGRRAMPEGDLGALAEGAEREDLLQAIADLDDAFDAGELEPEAYERRRKALKRRLLMMDLREDD